MKLGVLIVTAVLAPMVVFAAEGPKTPQDPAPSGKVASFETLDANKDGRISMPEASADPALVENFSTADKNGDGYLDQAEYSNAAKPRK